MENIELLKDYDYFQQTLFDCWLEMCHVYVAYSDRKDLLDTTLAWRELIASEIKLLELEDDKESREKHIKLRTSELISGDYEKELSLKRLYALVSEVITLSEDLITKAQEKTDTVGTMFVSRAILDTKDSKADSGVDLVIQAMKQLRKLVPIG